MESHSPFWILLVAPFVLVILALFIWSLIWAYQDAKKRGKPGWLVVLLVFLLNWPISLLAWLVFRPEISGPQKHTAAG